ncbi:MAG: outer membrane protein assembly factor BamA [Candidatus Krumholzibacteriota bacterium]|nr:outer membrane protein assembly factor BamA [Candidatus Krumholzibacteriota bacterium]
MHLRIIASRRLVQFVLAILLLCGPGETGAADFGIELPTVRRILILGNRSFDDETLKKRMRTRESRFYHIFRKPRYRRDFLRRDVQTIAAFYEKNGFFDAQVSIESVERDEKDNEVTIRILVNEGPQTTVRSLSFEGFDLVSPRNVRKDLRLIEGAPYNPNLLENDRYAILRKHFELGYLGAVATWDASVDSTAVDIAWSVDSQEPVRIDAIAVGGNRKVREGLITRELTFERGEFFRLGEVLESKQNLYNTGYFTSVEIEPVDLDVRGGTVDLNLQVRERRMGFIETGFGVGNVQGSRVFAEWGQRNLLGSGLALNVESSYAFQLFPDNRFSFDELDLRNKFLRHEGQLNFPHVLGTWNTFSIGASYERDATVEPAIVKATSATATVSRRFSRQTTLLCSYVFERIRRFDVVDERESSRRRSLDLNFTRDTRDFYFNPAKGNYVTTQARYSGGFLGGDDEYWSLVAAYQSYRRLAAGTVLAWRVRAGYADPFGKSEEGGLPIESRFFAGGGNSVRGYKENSLGPLRDGNEPMGGRILLLTNLELRFPIPWLSRYNLGMAAFLDGGNVWRSLDEIRIDRFAPYGDEKENDALDYRTSVGFGFRLNTPVGPLRLDVGFPMKRTPEMDYDSWVHISLGQIF